MVLQQDDTDRQLILAYEDDDGNVTMMDDMSEEGAMEVMKESLLRRGGLALRDYLTGKKNAASYDLYKFLCIIIVSLACIVCISLDIERTFFVSMLTFNMGLVADSPLNTRNLQPLTTPPPTS